MSARNVAVVLLRPGWKRARVLRRFRMVRSAEQFVADRQRTDPCGVVRGDYGIDAPDRRRVFK